MNQIAVVNQGGNASTERVIVLPGEEFDTLIGRPGYHLCENGDLERREGSLVYVMVRGKATGHYRWEKRLMSNERDHISDYFEAKGVSRGEFEALRRFGDYQKLTDGTLMRMEGKKEFRIYSEDSGWLLGRNGGRGVFVTSGFSRVLSEAHDRVVEKVKKDPRYLSRLREMLQKLTGSLRRNGPASPSQLIALVFRTSSVWQQRL